MFAKNTFLISAILFFLFGCSSNTVQINPNESKALNIAKAAGFNGGLKDVKIPQDTIGNLRDSIAYGALFTNSGYNAPSPGLTHGGTAAINLAGWLLEPDKPSAKPHIIAWQPVKSRDKESARDLLVKALAAASQKAAATFGMETWVKEHIKDQAAYIFITSGNDEYCADKEYCLLFGFIVDDSRHLKKSPEASRVEGESFFYGPYDQNLFTFNKEFIGFSELEFLQEVSKNLPEWLYLYAPPKHLKLDGDSMLPVPVVVNQGHSLFFVKPK